MNSVFKRVAGLRPGRSVFNLSYEQKLTMDMGQLIPVMCDEVVPGDIFKIGNEVLIRFNPLVTPIMHEVNAYVHYFFVPYRLLWEDWEEFITGGVDGESAPVIPTWEPIDNAEGSLWDYLGFPSDVDPAGAYPLQFPLNAYNFIFNEYYRDETLQTEVLLDQETVLNRNWEKDYFTSALPWQQRGTAPALPISGTTSAVWDGSQFLTSAGDVSLGINNTAAFPYFYTGVDADAKTNFRAALNANTVDLALATTFDVADLRLAFQIQKWLERNARAGARYVEFLGAHFGVHPRDDRLQRPEYIGGSKTPIIVSEVLQTSATAVGSPQGNLAGHGITADRNFVASYHAQEFGLIMGILSVVPKPAYQQGINRQWLRRTKYDFYFPEFANLSEQAIEHAEIAATDTAGTAAGQNNALFGYQGRYDEMRVKNNQVHGLMRDSLSFWHLGRIFDIPADVELNEEFIKCEPRKDIFAVPTAPGLIVNYANIIKAIRPLPIQSNPGLIDHM